MKNLTVEPREFKKLLSNWLGQYKEKVINEVINNYLEKIMNDETTLFMLRELIKEEEIESIQHFNEISSIIDLALRNNKEFEYYRSDLKSENYRKVLYDMYIAN